VAIESIATLKVDPVFQRVLSLFLGHVYFYPIIVTPKLIQEPVRFSIKSYSYLERWWTSIQSLVKEMWRRQLQVRDIFQTPILILIRLRMKRC